MKIATRQQAFGNRENNSADKNNWARHSIRKKLLLYFILSAMIFGFSFPVDAQQPGKVPRIGYLGDSPSAAPLNIEGFRYGLRELGYVEGKNILIEYRFAKGKFDRYPELAAEMVQLKVDVIVVGGGTGQTLPVTKATNTIPIVFTQVSDPVGAGLVTSLAHPGGNVTGLSSASQDLSRRRLELLKEIVSNASRIAVLYDATDPAKIAEFKDMEVSARSLQVHLLPLEVRRLDEFENAFQTATKGKTAALLVLPTSITVANRKQIVDLATKSRLATMWAESGLMDAGGLMSYGPNYADLYRRAAKYVDKILKGAKPADLPVERPMKFELVINLKAAKQIGLTIPPNVLARADRVIR